MVMLCFIWNNTASNMHIFKIVIYMLVSYLSVIFCSLVDSVSSTPVIIFYKRVDGSDMSSNPAITLY